MKPRFEHFKFSISSVYITFIASIFLLGDARLFVEQRTNKPIEPTNVESYSLGSSYALPPLESLPPLAETPPSGLSSPFTPPPPSMQPSPSSSNFPSKTPPTYTPIPRPPQYGLGPPSIPPSPHYHGPSPPIYQPPLVHQAPPIMPPPPPPPHKKPRFAVWCVAKPTVPDPIIQEALDYACGSGADCKSIQQNGPCFQPNNLVSTTAISSPIDD
ncbi:extensin isoform X2 [Hevea brasiliensis]|uniref:extensin isoform X2 n=1 Tax=Hevea brasiliensis TaxID=3981 RepID=UPI0025D85269|nr:extensin isoform X2 [Hevea brasiliensis]